MSALRAEQWQQETNQQDNLLSIIEVAHGQIEKRFLEGGAVLVSTIEILNTLVQRLDQVTSLLDEETTKNLVSNLQEPGKVLASLPSRQTNRLQKFQDLFDLSSVAFDKVTDMHLIIRYMQTFAITAKITGAGIADFATFAEEIRVRIQSGASEVRNLDQQITQMRQQLQKALSFSTTINHDFEATIPAITGNLASKSKLMMTQHDVLLSIAGDVRRVVGEFQMKIGSVLSSLQIGDITRQRLEHARDMLLMCDRFIAEPAGLQMGARDTARLKDRIVQLMTAQLVAIADEFSAGCADITRTIGSFKADANKIMMLRDQLDQQSSGGDGDILQMIRNDILQACELVARVQANGLEADAIVESVAESSRSLVHGVGVIRAIQSDIHYMSLNTNLRSSKLGDSGKSVKVVSDELRRYSEELDHAAEGIFVEFERLEGIADFLSQDSRSGIADISTPLTNATDMLGGLDDSMKAGLRAFAEEGDGALKRLEREIAKLDFKSNLGDILADCARIADDMSGEPEADDPALRQAAQTLNAQIYAIYTMRQERDIHQQIFPLDNAASLEHSKPTITTTDEEDLFADALF